MDYTRTLLIKTYMAIGAFPCFSSRITIAISTARDTTLQDSYLCFYDLFFSEVVVASVVLTFKLFETNQRERSSSSRNNSSSFKPYYCYHCCYDNY